MEDKSVANIQINRANKWRPLYFWLERTLVTKETRKKGKYGRKREHWEALNSTKIGKYERRSDEKKRTRVLGRNVTSDADNYVISGEKGRQISTNRKYFHIRLSRWKKETDLKWKVQDQNQNQATKIKY